MSDLARRFANNPIIGPADVPPTRPGLSVIGVLNPGAFRWSGRTWLLLRVAEGVPADGETVGALVRDASVPDGLRGYGSTDESWPTRTHASSPGGARPT